MTTLLLCICLFFCGFIVYAADAFDTINIPEYEKRMFGDEIITMDIQVDKNDWQDLLDNATTKEWISCDLIINGEVFSTVGIRTKGNSSLSQVTMSNNDRYSLQFKLNKYVKGQTYYGLDTFCINNLMGDATYMKDYLSYEIMKYIGVKTPLINYASVAVNGEDYGFCIALERYDKAFLDRVYNTSAGQLYNVKIQMGMRGNYEDKFQDLNNEMPNPQQGGGMGFGGSGGGSLIYTDDNISSYSAIFDNSIFNNSDKDKQRVITAIKNLNAGKYLEKYFDVDEILRYFAAHTVVVNLDSYISNMQQNYYIYERDGKITILPWDYGLALGGFQAGNASSVVNFPIDTPVSGVSMEDRPLLNMLLEVDEYKDRYHKYLQQIVEGYFESGLYENKIMALDTKINEYVKNDVSAFYTYEQYNASLPQLIELGSLRAKSIKVQLDGMIPSTSSGQNADKSSLIDASSVNLSALGSMMGGGGMGQDDWPGGQGRQPGDRDRQFNNPENGGLNMGLMQQAMQIIMEANGELTDEVKNSLLEFGLTEEEINMLINMQNGFPGGGMFGNGSPGREGQNAFPGGNDNWGDQSNLPNGNANTPPQNMNNPDGNNVAGMPSQNGITAITIVISLIILIGAIIFVARPRKTI